MAFSLLLEPDFRQKQERQGERGNGGPAQAVPHDTSGGGEAGWVQCLLQGEPLHFSPLFTVGSQTSLYFNTSGGTFYNPEKADYSDFEAWLQCYYVDGMKSVRDHNGRTMWFKVGFLFFFKVESSVSSFHRK